MRSDRLGDFTRLKVDDNSVGCGYTGSSGGGRDGSGVVVMLIPTKMIMKVTMTAMSNTMPLTTMLMAMMTMTYLFSGDAMVDQIEESSSLHGFDNLVS